MKLSGVLTKKREGWLTQERSPGGRQRQRLSDVSSAKERG